MARDDLKYHSIDMAAQHRVDLRLNVTRLVRLVEVDLSYSFFLVNKSLKFLFEEIVDVDDQVKLQCLKIPGDKITTVDSNLIAEALCKIPEVHIKKNYHYLDLNVPALIEKIVDSLQEDIKLKKVAWLFKKYE